jgi:hypothetical protein
MKLVRTPFISGIVKRVDEHEKYLRRERKVLYASFLRAHDVLVRMTVQLLDEPSDSSMDLVDRWYDKYNDLVTSSFEIELICTRVMGEAKVAIDTLWNDCLDRILDVGPEVAVAADWLPSDDGDVPHWPEYASRLRADAARAARFELGTPDDLRGHHEVRNGESVGPDPRRRGSQGRPAGESDAGEDHGRAGTRGDVDALVEDGRAEGDGNDWE